MNNKIHTQLNNSQC